MPTLNSGIFSNIPKKDYLSFFEDNETKYQSVTHFLDFKNEDVSKAAGVPLSSVRYDNKMPAELRDRIKEWATLLNLVAGHFQGDPVKTELSTKLLSH